ncbi:MAG TPA: tetratricopeptide repeat protein [Bacteroidales bacterium]|nr:tetratricopeptide repeat protein [Bacteroidales bacterium]
MKKQKRRNNIPTYFAKNALHPLGCKAFACFTEPTFIPILILLICLNSTLGVTPSPGQLSIHPALKAQAYLANQQTDSALMIISQLIEDKREVEKWLIWRSEIYLTQGKISDAINDLLQVEKKRPGMASFLLAKSYALLRDTNHTIFFLEKNLSSSFKVPRNIIMQEKAFHLLQNTKQWKKLWEKDWYNKYEYFEGEMRYLFEAKNWNGVINAMTDIGSDSKRLSAHAFYMTGVAYLQLENYGAALTYFNIAISRAKKQASYYAARGDYYLQLKNFSKALDDYTHAIQYSPESLEYYVKYIEALMGLKKSDTAYDLAQSLCQIFPTNNEILFIHARTAYQSKRYLQSLTSINKLLETTPEDSAYLHLRARCYVQTAMLGQALKDYDRLIQKYPKHSLYLLERGKIYLLTNDKQRYCSDWKKSAALGNTEASQLLWEYCSQ